jgi:acetylornithine deacetylase/succinyl-diaminopimelate desuccinylase-like protein
VLLRDLIRIDTSNPPGRATPAAMLLKDYLEANGVACELVARDPDRANLIACIPGAGEGPSMALIGHTDVVPASAEDWRHPPFSGHLDRDGFLWGRGAADMKNETATRAVAMTALSRSGFRPGGDLVFIAEADEEDGTERVGMTWLVHEWPDIGTDYALNEGSAERLVLADGRTAITVSVGEKAALAVRVTAPWVRRPRRRCPASPTDRCRGWQRRSRGSPGTARGGVCCPRPASCWTRWSDLRTVVWTRRSQSWRR